MKKTTPRKDQDYTEFDPPQPEWNIEEMQNQPNTGILDDRMNLLQWLLQKGGAYLGAAREFLKWNVRNGDSVTWGSHDEITMTVAQYEKAAAEIAAAAVAEDRKNRINFTLHDTLLMAIRVLVRMQGEAYTWSESERGRIQKLIEAMHKVVSDNEDRYNVMLLELFAEKTPNHKLLEALEATYVFLLRQGRPRPQGILVTLRNAIAGATGKEDQAIQEYYTFIAEFPKKARAEGHKTYQDFE